MTTFAHIETGFALDPQENGDQAGYEARFNAETIAKWQIVQVTDGTTHGASSDGQGGWVNPIPPAPPKPEPNNPGNPYFGKASITRDKFYGLAFSILGPAYPRLRNDAAFCGVKDIIDSVTLLDPDDKAGQFLQVIGYLQATNAADGHPLMSAQDVQKIMTAWP